MTDQPQQVNPIPVPPTPPEPPKPPVSRTGFSAWRLFFGLIIILFGLQLLANQFGWAWAANFNVWDFWPVLIILIGLSLLTRGHAISTTIGVVLAITLVAVVAVMGVNGNLNTNRNETTTDFTMPLETNAKSVNLTVDLGAAKIDIRSGSSDAVNGIFRSNFAVLNKTSTLSGDRQIVDINSTNRESWMFWGIHRNQLDLQLAETLPYELNMKSGAADLNLDLTKVRANQINIDAGASTIDLTLGELVSTTTVDVDAGASTITVNLPRAISGIRFNFDGGASTKHLPTELKEVNKSLYETSDYITATKKLNLSINAGASTINIRWI